MNGVIQSTTGCSAKGMIKDVFSTSVKLNQSKWFAEERRRVPMHTLYRRIRAFDFFMPSTISTSFDSGPLSSTFKLLKRVHLEAKWHKVIFSKESRFYLGMHVGRRRVLYWSEKRCDIGLTVERQVHRFAGAMIWGTIAKSRSSLLFNGESMRAA